MSGTVCGRGRMDHEKAVACATRSTAVEAKKSVSPVSGFSSKKSEYALLLKKLFGSGTGIRLLELYPSTFTIMEPGVTIADSGRSLETMSAAWQRFRKM